MTVNDTRQKPSLFDKFTFYKDKYGFLHTCLSYIGRYNFRIWNLTGGLATKNYIKRYLSEHQEAIVNLGGGGNCLEGVLTVDVSPRADAYVDITKSLPFKDSSIDGIFCEEVIEHVTYIDALKLLKECYRVLKPDGCIRLSTPSLEWFASNVLSGVDEPSINEVFYNHGHRFIYSEKDLKSQCAQAGFVNLEMSKYKAGKSRLGYLDTHADRFNHPPEISHYLEMSKPTS